MHVQAPQAGRPPAGGASCGRFRFPEAAVAPEQPSFSQAILQQVTTASGSTSLVSLPKRQDQENGASRDSREADPSRGPEQDTSRSEALQEATAAPAHPTPAAVTLQIFPPSVRDEAQPAAAVPGMLPASTAPASWLSGNEKENGAAPETAIFAKRPEAPTSKPVPATAKASARTPQTASSAVAGQQAPESSRRAEGNDSPVAIAPEAPLIVPISTTSRYDEETSSTAVRPAKVPPPNERVPARARVSSSTPDLPSTQQSETQSNAFSPPPFSLPYGKAASGDRGAEQPSKPSQQAESRETESGIPGQQHAGDHRREFPVTTAGRVEAQPAAASAPPVETMASSSLPVSSNSTVMVSPCVPASAHGMDGTTVKGAASIAHGTAAAAFQTMDAATPPKLLESSPQRLAVGIRDGGLGWLEIRTESAQGRISATLAAHSPEAQQAVVGQLPAMREYLAAQHVRVDHLQSQSFARSAGDGRNSSGNSGYREAPPGARAPRENQTPKPDAGEAGLEEQSVSWISVRV